MRSLAADEIASPHRKPHTANRWPSRSSRSAGVRRASSRTAATTTTDTAGLLRARGIGHSIARRGTEHGSGLGRHRWVVEHTIAHRCNKRRLLVVTDRSEATDDALHAVAVCLLCYSRYRTSLC